MALTSISASFGLSRHLLYGQIATIATTVQAYKIVRNANFELKKLIPETANGYTSERRKREREEKSDVTQGSQDDTSWLVRATTLSHRSPVI